MTHKIPRIAHRFSRRKLLLALGLFLLTCGGLVAPVTTINTPPKAGQAEFNPPNMFAGSYVYYKTGRSGGTLTLQDMQDAHTLRSLNNKLENQLKQFRQEPH